MKKLIVLCCIILNLMICISGCSQTKPEDIASNYISGATELDFDKIEKNSIVPYKTIFMAQINSYMESNQKTEEEIWQIFAENYEFDEVPKNFEEYKEMFTVYAKEEIKSQYGEDFSAKVSVITSEEKNENEINSILNEASDYYDDYDIIISDIISFADIKECKEVTCKIYLSGENVEEENSIEECSVYVVKIKNKWKVLNLGISY